MPVLSSSNQKVCLELARQAIVSHMETGDVPVVHTKDPELVALRGCFVTLRRKGSLRGCIGTFDAARPLVENVIRMASAAAFQDTRFPPVTRPELPDLQIELSVLGPLEKIDSMDKIELGRHGVLVRHGTRSGTYLPDVALEQKWNREEFVTHCAREKAGLKPDDMAKAELFRYEVEKFKESD